MNTAEEIKMYLVYGDYAKIAKMAGVSRKYAILLMDRPKAKKHPVVLNAARKVATANRKLGL